MGLAWPLLPSWKDSFIDSNCGIERFYLVKPLLPFDTGALSCVNHPSGSDRTKKMNFGLYSSKLWVAKPLFFIMYPTQIFYYNNGNENTKRLKRPFIYLFFLFRDRIFCVNSCGCPGILSVDQPWYVFKVLRHFSDGIIVVMVILFFNKIHLNSYAVLYSYINTIF